MQNFDGLDRHPGSAGDRNGDVHPSGSRERERSRAVDLVLRAVFDLRIIWQGDPVAARLINEMTRTRMLALREAGPKALRAGSGSVGLRLLAFVGGSVDLFDVSQARLAQLGVLVGQGETENRRSVHGRDPDGIGLTIGSSLTNGQVGSEDWDLVDEGIYVFGE
jgi:hypothetical protein